MLSRPRWVVLGLTTLAVSLAEPSEAQVVEPFASLSLRIDADCPFACDSFDLVFAGDFTSSNWQMPFVQRVERSPSGSSLLVYMSISYDSGVGLPVITPFERRIPYGPLPEGRYFVIYSIGFFNEPTPLPNRNVRDTIVIGSPGDVNCDRTVNIQDPVVVIDQIFRSGGQPDPPARSDLTCDARHDILDVLQAVELAFNRGSTCGPCRLAAPPLIVTDIPAESLAADEFTTMDVRLDGDSLRVEIAFGDGCLTHHFGMFMSPASFEGSNPRVAHIYPVYYDHNDNCEALVFQWISAGLQGLAQAYALSYPGENGPIVLRVHAYDPADYVDLLYSLP